MEVAVLVLVLALAAVNGGNDVPKGVATLAGAGVARIRTAIIWGTITTAIGCLVSLQIASKMTALFSRGIVSATPTAPFAAAVLIGAVAWVGFATWRRLPVSTTHALVGGLLGAGVLFSSDHVQWAALLTKVVQPLLLSVGVAWVLSALLSAGARRLNRAVGRRSAARVRPVAEDRAGAPTGVATAVESTTESTPTAVATGTKAITVLHWVTSGLTGFARGMNDAPKIVAIGSFALLGSMSTTGLLLAVTAVMAIGGLVVGRRIADRMANDVIRMSHVEGFTANLTTATLVSFGAFQGLPMSTTQVSVGAITGLSGTDVSRLKKKTIRDFAIAWLATPPFAAIVSAGAYLLLS